MEVKKVANLSDEEIVVLSKAGELAGQLKRAFESKDIDVLSDADANLINALADVFTKIAGVK